MDETLVGASGRTYHLLPHERWLGKFFAARFGTVDAPKRLLARNGLSATVLRACTVANALIVSPLSLALLIATTVVVHRHPQTVLPFIINIVLYVMLAGPFLFLQFRRRLQSVRETRVFRATA